MYVESLHVYPVKSFAAVDVAEMIVEPAGPAGDRRMMLVDPTGKFISQREEPRLARLKATLGDGGVTIAAADLERVVAAPGAERVAVTVWGAEVDAVGVAGAVDARLSDWLGRPVRLVAMDAVSQRSANPDWSPDASVGFADGFPVLVATTASLDALNERIVARGGAAVPMARFRPNVVVGGAEAWAEDEIATLQVGEVVFDLVKPCQRCIMTTTDQERGEVVGDEPLRTLATFRRSRDRRTAGVLFGWNAVPRAPGRIALGDPVTVLERRAAWPTG